jgi:hypothetical protein
VIGAAIGALIFGMTSRASSTPGWDATGSSSSSGDAAARVLANHTSGATRSEHAMTATGTPLLEIRGVSKLSAA